MRGVWRGRLFGRRQWLHLVAGVSAFWLTVWWINTMLSMDHLHHETTTTSTREQWVTDELGFLPQEAAEELCRAHNFPVYPHRTQRRKVYDLLMVNTELDWLEIRMHTLQDYVDYFVIVESPMTFTGLPKPLVLNASWAQFANWHDQILYHELNQTGFWSTLTWDHEDRQRDAMFDRVFPALAPDAPAMPQPGDVLLVSDVDEIPRPAAIDVLRNCVFPRRLTLRSTFYYYSFQWRHVGEQWAHPQATYFTTMADTLRPAQLRSGEGAGWFSRDQADLWSAAWHCSSCFATMRELLTKITSFSHTKYNQPAFREPTWLVSQVRQGRDLFNRSSELYERVDDNPDIPPFLQAVGQSDEQGTAIRDRFAYLIDRDPVNANFADVTEDDARSLLGQQDSLDFA